MQSYRIPDGTLEMCAVNDQIWCGSTSNDSTIAVINSADGQVERQLQAPDRNCRGLAYSNGNIWFLSENHIYRMNVEGVVLSVQNVPFDGMIGLASGENGLWTIVHSNGDAALVLFGPQGGEMRRLAIHVSDAMDFHFNGTNFWISSPPDGFIHQLGVDGATVNIFPTPADTPTGLTMIDEDIYLVDNGDDEDGDLLYKIDPASEATPRILPGALLHQFGLVNVFGGQAWDLSIYNIGGIDLRINEIVLLHGDQGFTRGQLPQQMVVAPGRFLIVRMTFSPRDYGPKIDSLIIRSNDPVDSILTVTCRGIGVFADRTLGMTPRVMDFGNVRADLERDGSKHLDLNIFNMGADPLFVQDVANHIPDIFAIQSPGFPVELQPTDTLNLRVWFTPHRAIQYVDTFTVRSTAVQQFESGIIRGRGDATVYAEGEVLWRSDHEGASDCGVVVGSDLNGDGVSEVISIRQGGVLTCLNGFSSETADPIWTQSFDGMNFLPEGVATGTEMFTGLHLANHDSEDLLFASGRRDASVYAISGESGAFLWRWSASDVMGDGIITTLLPGEDTDGNGMINPVVLVSDQGENSFLVRLDGETGQMAWYGAFDSLSSSGLLQLDDLTGDGISELLIYSETGRIITINGANGRIIRSQLIREFVEIACVRSTQDVNTDLLVIADQDSIISGIELLTGRTVWTTDRVDGIDHFGIINCFSYQTGGFYNRLICGDDLGNLILIRNLSTGYSIGRNITDASITTLSWAPPLHRGYAESILAGDVGGKVMMLEATELGEWWSFESPGGGDAEGIAMVLPFDDVDLGGTDDVLALLDNGDIYCISSGGDFSDVSDTSDPFPIDYTLANIFPNPFNDRLKVEIRLSSPAPVKISAFDSMGRQLGTIQYGVVPVGGTVLEIDRNQFSGATGSIFFNLSIGNQSTVMRGVYLK